MRSRASRAGQGPYPFTSGEGDVAELVEQERQWRAARGEPGPLGVKVMTAAGASVCQGVFSGHDGRLVDGLPLPASAPWRRETVASWSAAAADCRREGGAEALRRWHHRRMEDLFTDWCEELSALGQGEPVSGALAVLRAGRRIAPALAHLEAALDEPTWHRLDRRRRKPGAAWSELARRWRIHHAFVTGALGGPPDDPLCRDEARPTTPESLPSLPLLSAAKGG